MSKQVSGVRKCNDKLVNTIDTSEEICPLITQKEIKATKQHKSAALTDSILG